ncbi:MAG: zinc-ribbon domain-containing protein [Devosia sp.]|uniref:MJ0042-type zinc finger domain-containing protein n=1 Tax=Devosia sp. TaxID=1871048 RepID=UPI001AC6E541|nr:DUF3426 domain-containing protein [Devosia sp.]MBN9315147.1 zinc-ribbon domain-containing protein [Devosia sp.]
MHSLQPATVVIACPHCGTRYQVPPETLGARGRRVSCAHCSKDWLAEVPTRADEDRLFAPGEEEALDRQFDALGQASGGTELPESIRRMAAGGEPPPSEVVRSIAEIKAAIAPRVAEAPGPAPAERAPTAAEKAARGKLDKRQRAIGEALPAARLLRGIRLAAVLLLLAVVAGGYWFRTEIVRLVPDMAGVYSALGLGVNVVGLEFSDVSTVMTRRGDDSVLSVIARIRTVEPRRVAVPPVVVTLLDAQGTAVYQWSVAPAAGDIAPGEALDFTAELAAPPATATRLKLGFAGARPRTDIAPAALPVAAPPPNTTTNETH